MGRVLCIAVAALLLLAVTGPVQHPHPTFASGKPPIAYPGRKGGPTPTSTRPPSPTSTPGGAQGDITIAAAGDIACTPGAPVTSTTCHQQQTSNLLLAGQYAAVLALGDTQYNSGTLVEFQGSYDPTWGRVKSSTYPEAGNHEYNTPGASGYFAYFGSIAGDPSKGYYSFNLGAWHIIAVNSNCAQLSGGCAAGSPEEQWLRSDLQAHPGVCTLAFWHHPRWSSGDEGDKAYMQPIWQDLYTYHAALALTGHDHDYERFAPQDANGQLDTANGVREFVVGTGGFDHGLLYRQPEPNTQVRDDTTFGVLQLTLHQSGYDWQFVPEAGGTFTDSGSGACPGVKSPTPTPTATATATATATITPTPTQTPTPSPTATVVPTASTTVTPTVTPIPTMTPTSSATPTPSPTPSGPPLAGGTLVGQDSFAGRSVSGGWGTASDGLPWTLQSGTSSMLSVGGNEGRITGNPSSSYQTLTLGTATPVNAEVVARYSTGSFKDDVGRLLLRYSDSSDFYAAGLGSPAGTIELQVTKTAGGISSQLCSIPFSTTNNTFYWERVRVQNQGPSATISVKAWADGTAEPSSWQLSCTDGSPLPAGLTGVNAWDGGVSWSLDTFSAGDLGG